MPETIISYSDCREKSVDIECDRNRSLVDGKERGVMKHRQDRRCGSVNLVDAFRKGGETHFESFRWRA